MMLLLVYMMCTFVLLCKCAASQNSVNKYPAVCAKTCNSNNVTGTPMEEFCTKNSFTMVNRCCVSAQSTTGSSSGSSNNKNKNNTLTILGVDLRDCNMTTSALMSDLHGLRTLQYILLDGDNLPNRKPNSNMTYTSFLASPLAKMTSLIHLTLPGGHRCPGGPRAWAEEDRAWADGGNPRRMTVCRDVCTARNVHCPENSHCVHTGGAGEVQCDCDDGFKGYKCMSQGEFPLVTFFASVVAPTLVMAVVLWVTQRRYFVDQSKVE